jgi:uncharacterized protein (TIGR04551 family)
MRHIPIFTRAAFRDRNRRAYGFKGIIMTQFTKAIFLCLVFGSAVLMGVGESDQGPLAGEQAIPPLPPEEVSQPLSPEKPESSPLIVNYEESKMASGFFADNSFNTGASRSLNALDLAGYLRLRLAYFRNGHLGTYIPQKGYGTSNMPPSLDMISKSANQNQAEDSEAGEQNPAQNNFSGNMRLRVNPTINVSEVVRIKGSVDIFDNMILGSTPSYLSQGSPSPSWPSSLMSMSQNPPMRGVNSWQGAINVKRVYGEASFPLGELRFGRMPFSWGLGILYNSGDDISNDYGDQIDGISFTTRVFDHFISPSYSIAYTGPSARGGGLFSTNSDFQSTYLPAEAGQRYPLESGDITHVFSLSFLKRESDFIINKKRQEGRVIYDYGIFGSYRRQFLDSQAYAYEGIKFDDLAKNVVKRESHVGLLSLWQSFSYGTFNIEAEAAGIWGKYQIGEKATDLMAKKEDGTSIPKRPIWLLQGGFALESKYGFLNDRLQIGLNGGFASAQDGPGFGIREGTKKDPKAGDGDGRKMPSESGYKTNFKFNPAYTVDLLLYREVLGGISGTYYIKPHISYFFSRNFGMRGDVITSLAPNKSNTTGNSNWLGVELDASTFLRTENGFYFQLAYGVLFPLKGLNHRSGGDISTQQYKIFGEAQMAQTVQAYLGITF